MRTCRSRFSTIAVIACVEHVSTKTSEASVAKATAAVIVKNAVGVPIAIACAVRANTRMNVASVVKAIADATARNAASRHCVS